MITLVLGGTRSGKSSIAERLTLAHDGPVLYIATADVTDDDMAARVDRHRLGRHERFETIEADADLPATIAALDDRPALVDTLSTWLSRQPDFVPDAEGLCAALKHRRSPTVIVSDEVGSGIHPETDVGRRFRDALGELNQRVAAIATDVYFVAAGRVLPLRPPSEFGI